MTPINTPMVSGIKSAIKLAPNRSSTKGLAAQIRIAAKANDISKTIAVSLLSIL